MQTGPMNDRVNYVPIQSNLNWDEYFMLQAMMASFKSKDPNTKVGCVFVDEHNHQITMGYNGHVAGIDESKIPWGNNTDVPLEHQKYGYVVHSEANAILHSPRSLKNSKAYVTLFPCHECAKLIATAGAKEVIFLTDKYSGTQSNIISKKIFDYAGVKYRQMSIKSELIENLSQHLSHFL
jgi:dCMP deaminase